MEKLYHRAAKKKRAVPWIPLGGIFLILTFFQKSLDLPPSGRCMIIPESEVWPLKINEVETLDRKSVV